jgi:hypothetical protein
MVELLSSSYGNLISATSVAPQLLRWEPSFIFSAMFSLCLLISATSCDLHSGKSFLLIKLAQNRISRVSLIMRFRYIDIWLVGLTFIFLGEERKASSERACFFVLWARSRDGKDVFGVNVPCYISEPLRWLKFVPFGDWIFQWLSCVLFKDWISRDSVFYDS